jgi:phenylalanyl-tRNA synthetase beta chain
MKVSLNWLRDFLDIDKNAPEIAEILTSLGLEVEGWTEVKPSPVDLDKVLTGIVLHCERMPDTDHLSATSVDVGDGTPRSIVCGAPNVAQGQKVLVALPGAQVFSKDGTLFSIAERKVRGVPSQGMICAQDELGLGHDHSGIMVLPPDTPLGLSAAQYFQQEADTVFDIGLTPNRADAICHSGIAMDLLAWIQVHENPDAQPRSIEHFTDGLLRLPEEMPPPYPVSVENHEACPLYGGVTIEGIQVGESPDWLKNRLLAVGQRPINNVVDVTNYVRIELGQPLHAFDMDKIGGGKIIVKTLPEGTPFTTLDGVERKLSADDLMICDGNSRPMCIAGVFGGAESGVTDNTTRIFLECAVFNPKWIRRSMIRHGLRTDSAWAFEKGVDRGDNNDLALMRAAFLLEDLTGGKITTDFVEFEPEFVKINTVAIRYDRVNALIGENLPKERILRILDALGIQQSDHDEQGFTAWIPTNKPDVTREADVVEEILRIHGLDAVPIPQQIRSSMEIRQRPDPDAVRNGAADFLAANGFNECMGMSLINSAYHTGENPAYPLDKETLVHIHNSANQGLDCLRPTLLFSALETIRHNQNRQQADLRLFEMGKTYRREGEKMLETARLSISLSGAHSAESWQPAAKQRVDFYTLKTVVQNLLQRLGVKGFQETQVQDSPYQYALKYHRGPQELVVFGAVQPGILKKMDIKNAVFFADFHWENVLKAVAGNEIRFAELNRFPSVRRDLALVLDKKVPFGDISALAQKSAKKTLKAVNLFDVFEDPDKLGPDKKSYAVSFHFEDPEKTLQDKDIDALMAGLVTTFETKLNAQIRR